MFTKFRLKIRNFIRDNRKKIIIFILVWLLIFIINFLLGIRKQKVVLNTSYTPNKSVIDNANSVPKKDHIKISNILDTYFNYCNNSEYDNAFKMLSNSCKEKAFNNDINKFVEYVKSIYTAKKRYSIQNYSNYENKYIYTMKIFNDIITTGLTGEEYSYYEEKVIMTKENDEIKLNVGDFIDKVDLKRVVEDDYSKIRILSKAIFYDHEEYNIKITNKTDYIMVMSSVYESEEILLDLGNIRRQMTNSNLEIALNPGETKEFTIKFQKYADEEEDAQAIILNKIRILKAYSGKEESSEKEKANAIKLYSLTIPLI
ncbi:MAG: hypothetical protein HFJ43_01895 [Clostridia bacterium]|nr:hypothetical protein [Clostridia bacterium]